MVLAESSPGRSFSTTALPVVALSLFPPRAFSCSLHVSLIPLQVEVAVEVEVEVEVDPHILSPSHSFSIFLRSPSSVRRDRERQRQRHAGRVSTLKPFIHYPTLVLPFHPLPLPLPLPVQGPKNHHRYFTLRWLCSLDCPLSTTRPFVPCPPYYSFFFPPNLKSLPFLPLLLFTIHSTIPHSTLVQLALSRPSRPSIILLDHSSRHSATFSPPTNDWKTSPSPPSPKHPTSAPRTKTIPLGSHLLEVCSKFWHSGKITADVDIEARQRKGRPENARVMCGARRTGTDRRTFLG